MKFRSLLRNVSFATTTSVAGLSLLVGSGHAQNTQSQKVQKENIMTLSGAAQSKNDGAAATEAIRPFHVNHEQNGR